MSCWSFLRCRPPRPSDSEEREDPWDNIPWRTPQWHIKETPPWTYNKLRGLDDDDGDDIPPVNPRTPKHRLLQSPGGILKERRDWRPTECANLPVRNPGISVLPANIPRLFPQTPGNGRPRSFVDPNPAVGETLANSIPTPCWQPINPWVGNSFVGTAQDGSGRSLLCTPFSTPGSLPQSVRPLPGASSANMLTGPLPVGTSVADTPANSSGAWVHLRRTPSSLNTPLPGTPFIPARQTQDADIDNAPVIPPFLPARRSQDGDIDNAPVIPPFIPNTPSFLQTPRNPPTHFSAGGRTAGVPTETGVWVPMEQLGWEPHPCPDPMLHADAFWTPHPFSVPRQICPPKDAESMLRLTGGVPAPGTAPGWVTPAWPTQPSSAMPGSISLHLNPTLAPNPNSAWLPHLIWDVSEHPDYARRLTGRDLTVPLTDRLDQSAVWPNSTVLHIYVDHHLATTAFWGPIVVKNKKAITVYDVLLAIFDYFQKQLRREEYDYLVGLDPDNMVRLCDSFQQRCMISRNQLPMYERAQGLRRIDTFGDKKRWWGVWVTHKPGGASYLNLGLVDARRLPGTF